MQVCQELDKQMNRVTAYSYFISAVFHLSILFLSPGIRQLEPLSIPKWIEADIIPMPEPRQLLDNILDLPVPESGQVLDSASSSQSSNGEDPGTQNTDNPIAFEGSTFPNPPLNLPELTSSNQTDRILVNPGPSAVNYGDVISDSPDRLPTIFDRNKTKQAKINTETEGPPAFDWQPARGNGGTTQNVNSEDMPLQGPVSKRRIIYRPSLPEPVATVGGVVSLKFWVHADGTIGKIVPIRRSDPVLEQAAIDFLESWRFEPVSADSADQWGILPIRFKLQ
jgi:TonB family protein